MHVHTHKLCRLIRSVRPYKAIKLTNAIYLKISEYSELFYLHVFASFFIYKIICPKQINDAYKIAFFTYYVYKKVFIF